MGVKHYEKSFKERAVKLSYERGSVSQVCSELGVSSSQLRKWCKDYQEFGSNSFPGRGIERLTDEQREIKKLQKELKESHLDVELLKKAIAFFSRAEK